MADLANWTASPEDIMQLKIGNVPAYSKVTVLISFLQPGGLHEHVLELEHPVERMASVSKQYEGKRTEGLDTPVHLEFQG